MKSCLVCIAAILLTAQAVPFPGPGPNPYAAAAPAAMPSPFATAFASPRPSCCGVGQACGLGLCGCCEGSSCENGACAPIISYADGFYGAPRIQGGYGNTYGYGR